MNSIVGFTLKETMKLLEKLYDQEVLVLMSNEATPGFISGGIVERLRLPFGVTGSFGVLVGNSVRVKNEEFVE